MAFLGRPTGGPPARCSRLVVVVDRERLLQGQDGGVDGQAPRSGASAIRAAGRRRRVAERCGRGAARPAVRSHVAAAHRPRDLHIVEGDQAERVVGRRAGGVDIPARGLVRCAHPVGGAVGVGDRPIDDDVVVGADGQVSGEAPLNEDVPLGPGSPPLAVVGLAGIRVGSGDRRIGGRVLVDEDDAVGRQGHRGGAIGRARVGVATEQAVGIGRRLGAEDRHLVADQRDRCRADVVAPCLLGVVAQTGVVGGDGFEVGCAVGARGRVVVDLTDGTRAVRVPGGGRVGARGEVDELAARIGRGHAVVGRARPEVGARLRRGRAGDEDGVVGERGSVDDVAGGEVDLRAAPGVVVVGGPPVLARGRRARRLEVRPPHVVEEPVGGDELGHHRVVHVPAAEAGGSDDLDLQAGQHAGGRVDDRLGVVELVVLRDDPVAEVRARHLAPGAVGQARALGRAVGVGVAGAEIGVGVDGAGVGVESRGEGPVGVALDVGVGQEGVVVDDVGDHDTAHHRQQHGDGDDQDQGGLAGVTTQRSPSARRPSSPERGGMHPRHHAALLVRLGS